MSKARERLSSRRAFLGGAAAAGIAAAAPRASEAATATNRSWTHTADIVVVGTGAAGLSAAIAATRAGAQVIILEKAAAPGGTTAKSEGAYWIPNNHHLRAKGRVDRKEDALRYMVRGAYPFQFRDGAQRHGIGQHEFDLIEAFYDNAGPVVEELEQLNITRALLAELPDYQDHYDGRATPSSGRVLLPLKPDGSVGPGRELVRQLRAWLDAKKVPVLLRHAVTGIERDSSGRVIGVSVNAPNGPIAIRARKAVVFGSGGFTHNPELMTSFQAGPSWGGCAVPTNQGDFVRIGSSHGAKLGNMGNAWRAQLVLELALATPSVAQDVWQPPGDSMILVNKYGRRVVNEKRNYHERTRTHFVWDGVESEYPNKLMFMVYDRRTAELFAGNQPLPQPGEKESYVIEAASLGALERAIQERLDALSPRIGRDSLSSEFGRNLEAQVARFNADAAKGVDSEFKRGLYPYDAAWHSAINSVPRQDTPWKPAAPNPCVYPIDVKGPLYAIILGAGTLDTNGGPVANARCQILNADGQPIPGLYGAGNCVASPAGGAYWGAGGTLGPALTFGTLAGRAAAAEPITEA
jgi:succinate dehydrogenase/fumarate reductase flavoprotein subunit